MLCKTLNVKIFLKLWKKRALKEPIIEKNSAYIFQSCVQSTLSSLPGSIPGTKNECHYGD